MSRHSPGASAGCCSGRRVGPLLSWDCVDVTASSLLRHLRSENNCYRINCVDNLLILLSTLFAFKLKVLLANLTCLLQEAFRLN